MLCTPNRAAVAGFSSTFSLAMRTRPAISAATSSSTGPIVRHGPHHGAHISSSTGTGERSTSFRNVASVTVIGFPEEAEVFCSGRKPALVRAPASPLVLDYWHRRRNSESVACRAFV